MEFLFATFGIDWLNDRWEKGSPSTYQEFADYWIAESGRRKNEKPKPKKEWALLNFMQRAKKDMPNISRDGLVIAWKKLRAEKAAVAMKIIQEIVKS